MARARPGRDGRVGRLRGSQGSALGVEPIDQDLVQAEVGREREAVRLVRLDHVAVRALLALGVGDRARVLDEGRGGLHPAVRADGQAGHAAAAVVRDEHVAAAAVDHEVTGSRAARRGAAQCAEVTRGGVDGERA